MRQTEVDYWETMATQRIFADGGILDNPVKRVPMLKHMLAYSWAGHKVLEIGIGAGLTAAALYFLTAGTMKYLGTDLSKAFCDNAARFGLNAVQADVTKLPGKDGEYTRIVALDSLEHVRPEDREAGYREIERVMAQDGRLFINIPLSESNHVTEFDHGFGLSDLLALEKVGLKLEQYNHYKTIHPHASA
jgi:ubiquinone/menaquinone biosynthesis C-methylase UbiE